MNFGFNLFNSFNKNDQNELKNFCKIKRSRFLANCCGIVGYLGHEDTNEVLLHGIEAMKSRGYDSCGICTLDNGKLLVTKCCSVGTPADSYSILKKKVLSTHPPSRVGIGHTRWATVGKPSDKNSHPHVDLSMNLALVHNGTISNIEELYTEHYKGLIDQKFKKCSSADVISQRLELVNGMEEEYELKEKECKFKLPDSDTESLAIFVGLEYEKVGDLYTAFKNTIKKLKGTWALCMMSTMYPNSLFVAAHEAPLLFARSKRGIYVGSEPTVFMKYAKDCIALNDGEVFELSLENVESYYRRSKLLKLEHEVIEYTHEPYPNWYTKEISEQMYLGRIIISMLNTTWKESEENRWKVDSRDMKELLQLREKYAGNDSLAVLGGDPYRENMLLSRIDLSSMGFKFANLTEEAETKLKRAKRLLFVACGSSYHAASYVAKILQKLNFFELVEVDDASDLTLYRYYDRNNTVVHISNSGETLDCILASNYIKKINQHCLNVSLINTLHSSLERASDTTIHLRIGREKSVPSTKAVTAQIILLLMFGLYIIQNYNAPSKENTDALKDDRTEYSISVDDEYTNSLSDTPTKYTSLVEEGYQDGNYAEHYGSCENYRITSLYKSLSMFPSAVSHMLKDNPRYDQIAKKLFNEKIVYILGRGCGHTVALEASLKMKEVAYIQTEGVLSGAMKHGYYAMIIEKEKTPTISIITSEDKEMTLSATMQLKARGSYIIAFTDLTEDVDFADIVVQMPNIGALTSALALIPFQIITSKIAILSGRNPDIPRGLAKTVTTL